MGKSIPFQIHEENVGILRNELPFLVADEETDFTSSVSILRNSTS